MKYCFWISNFCSII